MNKKLVKHLAKLNPEDAAELLQQLGVTSVNEVTLRGLHKLMQSKKASLKLKLRVCWLIQIVGSKQSVGILLEAFNDKDEDLSHMAKLALSVVTSEKALEALIGILQHSPERRKRRDVAYLLRGYFDNERATDALISSLNDKSQFVETRAEAAESLGALRATRATNILLANLDDPSLEVRFSCIFALGQVGLNATIIPKLQKFLTDESVVVDSTVGKEAYDAIEAIKARVMALENYDGDESTADIWDTDQGTLE